MKINLEQRSTIILASIDAYKKYGILKTNKFDLDQAADIAHVTTGLSKGTFVASVFKIRRLIHENITGTKMPGFQNSASKWMRVAAYTLVDEGVIA